MPGLRCVLIHTQVDFKVDASFLRIIRAFFVEASLRLDSGGYYSPLQNPLFLVRFFFYKQLTSIFSREDSFWLSSEGLKSIFPISRFFGSQSKISLDKLGL